jgi:hypothetical protein
MATLLAACGGQAAPASAPGGAPAKASAGSSAAGSGLTPFKIAYPQPTSGLVHL